MISIGKAWEAHGRPGVYRARDGPNFEIATGERQPLCPHVGFEVAMINDDYQLFNVTAD